MIQSSISFDISSNSFNAASSVSVHSVSQRKSSPRVVDKVTDIACVRIAPQIALFATAKQVWFCWDTSAISYHFLSQCNHRGSVAVTRNLLDGAILLARRTAKSDAEPLNLTPILWVWSLIGQYHLTHSTPSLMQEAARRFTSRGQKDLAEWASQKAIEESGHGKLALLDLKSLGYDAEAMVKSFCPPVEKALLNYFTRSVRVLDPIYSVGYSYAMERLALTIDKTYIQAVESLLPSDVQATRCVRVHSNLGSDVDHVEEALEFIAQLPSQEQARIVTACYETASLYFNSPKSKQPSDFELQQSFKPFVR